MHDGSDVPPPEDFKKTLAVMLLAQYAAVTGWLALLPTFGSESLPRSAAFVIGLVLPGLLAISLASNASSMFVSWRFRRAPDFAPYARLSLRLTAAQSALLVASIAFGTHRFSMVACAFTAITIVAVLRWTPGRMLRPPSG